MRMYGSARSHPRAESAPPGRECCSGWSWESGDHSASDSRCPCVFILVSQHEWISRVQRLCRMSHRRLRTRGSMQSWGSLRMWLRSFVSAALPFLRLQPSARFEVSLRRCTGRSCRVPVLHAQRPQRLLPEMNDPSRPCPSRVRVRWLITSRARIPQGSRVRLFFESHED